MDPDKAENEIKENTEPDIPSITAAPATAPAAPAAAPATPATAPATPAATLAFTGTVTPASLNQQNPQSIETQRMLFKLYKL